MIVLIAAFLFLFLVVAYWKTRAAQQTKSLKMLADDEIVVVLNQPKSAWVWMPEWTFGDPENPKYPITMSTYTCGCPDWQKRRKSLPERHIARCCKHICREIAAKDERHLNGWSKWAVAILKCRYGSGRNSPSLPCLIIRF